MRAASDALKAAFAARTPMWSADLFTLSLRNGYDYRFTGADEAVTWGGHTFAAGGPAVERTTWSSKNTTEIPSMTVQIYSTGSDFATSNPMSDIINGLFDGGYLLLQRAFMPKFGNTSLGAVTLFGGMIGACEVNAQGAKLTITASNVALEQNIPRRTYEASCLHTLYDGGCTLNSHAYRSYFNVASANAMFIALVSPPSDMSIYFQGMVDLVDGLGNQQSATITGYNSSGIAFSYPLLIVPSPGDAVLIYQGCDKTMARCQAFGNILNYGGFPYVPPQSYGI